MTYLYEKDIILVSKINLKSLEDLLTLYEKDLKTYYRRDFFDNMFSDNKEYFLRLKEKLSGIEDIEYIEFKNTSIYAGLYKYVESLGKGIRLKSKKIKFSVRQIELSEYFSLNPYKLKSDFSLILCDNANRLIDELNDEENLVHIGYITNDKQKLIMDREAVQFISKYDESLYKLLK